MYSLLGIFAFLKYYMKTKLLLIVFIISTFAFSANSNEDTTKIQIENLQKENESLKKEIEIIKAKSESTSIMIDNVDSMYQNNFDRMIFLFGSLGAIIVFASPIAVFFYNKWLKDQQKKLIELKEVELNASNEERISKFKSEIEQKFTDSKNEYNKKLNEEKKNLEEKLNASNEEKIKEVLKHSEERFKTSQDDFYNKLDETNKILEDSIIQKSKELEQKITKSNYSLHSKIYLSTTNLYQTNKNYDYYTNSYLHYLYNIYKAEDFNLKDIIKKSNQLIYFIEHKNVFIVEGSISIIDFFIEEYNLKQKELNLGEENPFIKLKNTVKEKVD